MRQPWVSADSDEEGAKSLHGRRTPVPGGHMREAVVRRETTGLGFSQTQQHIRAQLSIDKGTFRYWQGAELFLKGSVSRGG